MKFFIKDLFSKSDKIRRKIWNNVHATAQYKKKSIAENFVFVQCVATGSEFY